MRIFFVLFALLQILLGFRPLPFRQSPVKDDGPRTLYTIPYSTTTDNDQPRTHYMEAAARRAYDCKILYSYRDLPRYYADRRHHIRHIIAIHYKPLDDTYSVLL